MDFQEYVAARRTALVRAAVLLGVAQVAAPKIVRDVLLQEAGHIERRGDPDPVVLAALVLAARPESARLPEGDEPGLAVRRTLAGMAPPEREVAVLAFHADLTPHEEAAALELEVDAVVALEATARQTLGVPDRVAARELMMLAADTVPPPPGDAIVRPARRARWPAVAAVAVAAVALTAAAVAASNDPEPVLDDDQVPSLFGYDADAARALLAERGLRVEQRRTRTCEVVETVVGSEPPTGARFEPGDTVTIWTAVPSDPFCMARYPARLDAWKFLQWAAGRGPAPEFAGSVDVVVDDSDPVTLTGDQAVDRERWGDPGVLTLLVRRPRGGVRRARHDGVPDAAARRPAHRAPVDELRSLPPGQHGRPAGAVAVPVLAAGRTRGLPGDPRPLPRRGRDRHRRPLHREGPALTGPVGQ